MAEIKTRATRRKGNNGNGFKPGQSGNPGGRPKIPEEFKELARANSVKALKKAIGMMDDPSVPPQVQLKAAEVVMERAWGKANQPLSGLDEGPLTIKVLVGGDDD